MARFKEPLKTALLVLLTLSAVLLAWKGNLFGGLFPVSEASPPPSAEEILSCVPAALPAAAALTGQSGLRYGVKYNAGEMSRLFDACSPLLAEALGSAEEPGPIREEDWQERLKGAGLYLEYAFPLPVSVLAAWVGGEVLWAEEETGVAFLLDRAGDGSVRLCFRSGDGEYRSSGTAASWTSIQALLEDSLPNGAAFAFDLPELGSCDPYALVLEELPPVYAALAAGGQGEAAAALAEEFGIHLSGQSRYTEADGTLVYPGEAGVLRLGTEGEVSFTAAGTEFTAAGTAERIESVRRLLGTVHEAYAVEEELTLTGLRQTEGTLSMTFGYMLDGIPVQLSAGPAASAEWGPEGLRELTVFPRRYLRSGVIDGLLPEKQAEAAAGSLYPGSAAGLILLDRGDSRVGLSWAVALEGRLLWTQED